MARPQEGLGEAFSCRLRNDQDKLAREERDATGRPLSSIVREWCDGYFRQKEELDYLRARIIGRSKKKDKQYGLTTADENEFGPDA
jgi:hypothetical protein